MKRQIVLIQAIQGFPGTCSTQQTILDRNVQQHDQIGTKLTEAWEVVKPQEASVEFSLKLMAMNSKLSGLLIEGSGEASLKVTLTWKDTTGA
jgi:hypothetical protein